MALLDEAFVIDAIGHAYNLSAENAAGPTGGMVREGLAMLYSAWNPPEVQVPKAVYQADQPIDVLSRTFFTESATDLAVYHTLRLDSLFRDGMCSHEKNVEAQARWPQRWIAYVGVDPTTGLERAIADLERQVAEVPNAIGLKLYPDQVEPYRTWRMDDPALAFPLFERAADLGLRIVAVHKALPNGPVPLNPYRVEDLEGAAMAFPHLQFEIVHAGMAFVEETAHALARFPNVFANLEVTASLLHRAPGMFEEVLGSFLFWGGPAKVLWGTGCNFAHPQPLLERFTAFSFSERALDRFGLPQIDDATKALILGGNYAAMAGIDIAARRAAIADDEFARAVREQGGLAPPNSAWLAHARAAGLPVDGPPGPGAGGAGDVMAGITPTAGPTAGGGGAGGAA